MGKKVILIEDDPSIIELYKIAFKSAGINFEALSWGKDAIKLIHDIQAGKAEKPGLFLIDLLLPDVNGIDILKEAKPTSPQKIFPLLF